MDGDHKNNKRANLMLIHGHCHDQITAQMLRTHDKGSVTEEPCAGKLARTVVCPAKAGVFSRRKPTREEPEPTVARSAGDGKPTF